jgi:hypothetical protein
MYRYAAMFALHRQDYDSFSLRFSCTVHMIRFLIILLFTVRNTDHSLLSTCSFLSPFLWIHSFLIGSDELNFKIGPFLQRVNYCIWVGVKNSLDLSRRGRVVFQWMRMENTFGFLYIQFLHQKLKNERKVKYFQHLYSFKYHTIKHEKAQSVFFYTHPPWGGNAMHKEAWNKSA